MTTPIEPTIRDLEFPDAHARDRPGRRAALAVVLAVSVASVSFVSSCKKPASEAPAAAKMAPKVLGPESVHTVSLQTIQTGPRISGSLEAKQQAVIRAELGGSVTDVKVELGDAVKRNQVLARIEDQAQRDALVSAESAVRSAEQEGVLAQRQVERTTRLVEGGALAARDLELAQSALISASARLDDMKSRLASSRNQLDGATLKAPFDGVVSVRAVNSGDVVAPGAAMFTVIDPSSMRLTGSVPSDEVGAIAVGKEVTFEVKGYPGQLYTGKLERVAPAADALTRQITVLVSIPNPGGRLIAGLFAEGRIAAEVSQALVVPSAAVDLTGALPRVYRITDGKVQAVEVTTGLRDSRTERVEIKAGLQSGDVIIASAARSLPPGTAVTLSGTSGTSDTRDTGDAGDAARN